MLAKFTSKKNHEINDLSNYPYGDGWYCALLKSDPHLILLPKLKIFNELAKSIE